MHRLLITWLVSTGKAQGGLPLPQLTQHPASQHVAHSPLNSLALHGFLPIPSISRLAMSLKHKRLHLQAHSLGASDVADGACLLFFALISHLSEIPRLLFPLLRVYSALEFFFLLVSRCFILLTSLSCPALSATASAATHISMWISEDVMPVLRGIVVAQVGPQGCRGADRGGTGGGAGASNSTNTHITPRREAERQRGLALV